MRIPKSGLKICWNLSRAGNFFYRLTKRKRSTIDLNILNAPIPAQDPIWPIKAKLFKCLIHRLINITERVLDVGFFKIWMKTPVSFAQSAYNGLSLSCNSTRLRQTPPGFCLRVMMVNEFHPNLEKTTPSVLSVILITLWFDISVYIKGRPHFGNLIRHTPN